MTIHPRCGHLDPRTYQTLAIGLTQFLRQGGLFWVTDKDGEKRLVPPNGITLDGGMLVLDLTAKPTPSNR